MRTANNFYAASVAFFENNRAGRFGNTSRNTTAQSGRNIALQSSGNIALQESGAQNPHVSQFFAPTDLFTPQWELYSESDRLLVERTRQAFELTDRDDVRVFVIPASQRNRRGLQTGSFIHRPTTSRQTERLNISINRLVRQIAEKEIEIANNSDSESRRSLVGADDENSRYRAERDSGRISGSENDCTRELHLMRTRLEEYRLLLRREQQRLASGPRRGWIVVEREE